MQTLGQYVEEVHAINEEKGFHEPMPEEALGSVLPLAVQLGGVIAALESVRKGQPVKVPYLTMRYWNQASLEAIMRLLLIASECFEAAEAICEGRYIEEAPEIADIVIRCFDYAGVRDIDLDVEVRAKMDKNRERPYKHGHRF